MPELPEVQTVVNDLLDLKIEGRKINGVKVFWHRSVHSIPHEVLSKKLNGKTIAGISRRGKYIVFRLNNESFFIIHLRMSGRIRHVDSNQTYDKHEHVIIRLDNGFDIRFYDPRKFGRLYMGADAVRQIDKLGPEPLDKTFTFPKFERLISHHRRKLKPLLLDQSIIAGLGNIYTDEALWQARLHPECLSSSLESVQRKNLYHSIRLVLKWGIKNFGTSLGEGESNFISANKRKGRNRLHLNVYGRGKEKCPRCANTIERIIVAQRSTHICPNCQILN